ncbi:MAG: OprO/OprP family phosphate-selective porin [Cypionkella sp.]
MITIRRTACAAAIALAASWGAPSSAQDAAAVAEELARMRAQMAAMASRIDTLEAQLAAARAEPVAPRTPPPRDAPPKAEAETRIAFKGAPEITGKGGWSFKPRGRLQMDAGFVDAPEATGRPDGFGSTIRRARLGAQGEMPGGFGYRFEVDFAGDAVTLTDAYLTYAAGDLTVTVGQHNNFQSLEELTSSLHSSFIERAAFTDAFGFERRLGVSAEYETGDLLLQAGAFGDNNGSLPSGNLGFDGRLVYAPRLGAGRLHLGASIHHYAIDAAGSTVRYRQRPLVAFTGERFINTGAIGAKGERGYGLEAAFIRGPLHLAGEAFWQRVDRPGALADPTFFGGYAEAGLFLTRGDTRGYDGGEFARVKPKNPVGKGGFGAVQVNLRYDYLDLIDAGIVGGRQDGFQAGLSWMPTDYTKLMLNYGHLRYGDAAVPAGARRDYAVDVLGLRAQIDF